MHTATPGPGTRVQIRYLVMHDVAARFPKRLTRNDLSRLITLELEEDFALEYVTEYRSGMAMRRQSFVRRRELDVLRHRMRAFGNPGRGDAQKVSDLGVSCNQHVFYASPDLAVVRATSVRRTGASYPQALTQQSDQHLQRCQPCARRGRGIADHQTVAISFGIGMAKRGKPLQMGETAREKRLERLIRISSSCHL